MAMFRKVDRLAKASDRRGYFTSANKLLQRLLFYFNQSGARELGFEGTGHGTNFGYITQPTNVYMVAMTFDKEKRTRYLTHFIEEKAVLVQVTIDPKKPLEAKASLYDVRGMEFNDIGKMELRRMKPELTRDLDLTHPIVSMRELFAEFEKYAFTRPPPEKKGGGGDAG